MLVLHTLTNAKFDYALSDCVTYPSGNAITFKSSPMSSSNLYTPIAPGLPRFLDFFSPA